MKEKVLTDMELRAHWAGCSGGEYPVEPDTIVTPAAHDFLRERGIRLCRKGEPQGQGSMTVTPIPVASGKAQYQNALTGEVMDEKGELMTHLRGNLLVPKTHPRIVFRGRLDSLMAQWLRVQLLAEELGDASLAQELEELLRYLRIMLAAEVQEKPLEELNLLGMSSEEIRRVSHRVKDHFGIDHPIPSSGMGRLCVELNCLRTQVRETELMAAAAFTDEDGRCKRTDILEGLNRLSSCVYILFCRQAAGRDGRRKNR